MNHLFIPLIIAAVVLVPLGLLLWWGARERQRVYLLNDPDLGQLKLYRTYWEASDRKRFLAEPVSVSGTGNRSGPTPSQKQALQFIAQNARELFASACAAGKAAVLTAAPDAHPDDLWVAGVFLESDPDCFELLLESAACSSVVPDGVAVSFKAGQVYATELVH